MTEEIMDIRAVLERRLTPSRYEHTIGVSYTSMALAMRYSCDLYQAELAGLLHDCAKYYTDDTIIRKCQKKNIELTEQELKAPAVLHARYGAWAAENKYGIKDQTVLGAIRWHTTGRPAMTLLEKIVFTADYIEPGRCKAADLPVVRPLAFMDIDECVYMILKDTLEYLKSRKNHVDTMTNEAYDYYKKLHDEKENTRT